MNIGHCYRKLNNYEKAIECYRRTLAVTPLHAPALSGLAFTYQLRGDLHTAIEYYHQSLSVWSDDPFANDMLATALAESAELPLDVAIMSADLPLSTSSSVVSVR